jgi:serine phosphatase RsbU (regulator of sigma subunit)/putative methionine-R-sulfoxide reductase with GAF domain
MSLEEQSEKKLISLMGILNRITTSLDLDKTLASIIDEAKNLINAEWSSILRIDPESQELYFIIATDNKQSFLKQIRIPKGKSVAGIVAESGEGLIINDAANDPRLFRKIDEEINIVTRNIMCVPLKISGKAIGVLQTVNKSGGGDFTAEDFSLLQSFSDFAALAINNRELYRDMERKAQESYALYRLADSINDCDTVDDLLSKNIQIVSEIMEAGRVSIVNRIKGRFKMLHGKGVPESLLDQDISGCRILQHIADTGKGVFSANIKEDERFAGFSQGSYTDDSFVAVPMKMKNRIVSFLSVTERRRSRPYLKEDMQLLEMLAQQIIENYYHLRLFEEFREKQKMDSELSIASRIQQDIIPKSFSTEGLVEVAAMNLPAKIVGGDFYDFIPLSKNRVGTLIADVSGKGISAGLFMAISHSILRLLFQQTKDPAKVLQVANRFICAESKSSMFVTCFCCMVNSTHKTIKYVNAGHGNQFLYSCSQKKLTTLTSTTRPLGVREDSRFDPVTIKYKPGDLLFLYTDGVTDALNEKGEQYGEKQIISFLENMQNGSTREIVNELMNNVLKFQGRSEQFDDLTVLAIKFPEPPVIDGVK